MSKMSLFEGEKNKHKVENPWRSLYTKITFSDHDCIDFKSAEYI